MNERKLRGRPAGSGAQLPAGERIKHSRARRAAAGSARVEIVLDVDTNEQLQTLMEHWQCKTKKEAIEQAITSAYQTIRTPGRLRESLKVAPDFDTPLPKSIEDSFYSHQAKNKPSSDNE
jgi:hypothetical protein